MIAFANPLRDLAGDSTYLAEFLRTLTGPIVLVGHSYGGNVISTAATGNDQVKALVYTQRMDVRRGREPAGAPQAVRRQPRGALDQARALHQRGRERRRGPLPRPGGVPGGLCAVDVDQATADVMAAAQRPYAAAAFAGAPSSPRRGRHCRAGTWSAQRTRRSRRHSNGSWPSARTRRSWRCRPLTFRSCHSPTPRPSSSFRPSSESMPSGKSRLESHIHGDIPACSGLWEPVGLPTASQIAHAGLPFANPMSEAAVDAAIAALPLPVDASLVDTGCGSGEMLVRALTAHPGARGLGIDLDPDAITEARRRAVDLPARFETRDASGLDGAFDAVINVGSSHAHRGVSPLR